MDGFSRGYPASFLGTCIERPARRATTFPLLTWRSAVNRSAKAALIIARIILPLCTMQLALDVRADEVGISPIALLRGLENVRLGTPKGRIRCKVVHAAPPNDPQTSVVTLEFDEARRRISTATSMSVVDAASPTSPATTREVTRWCVFDGDALYEYDGIASAVRVPPAQASPDWAFDPRILGITVLYRPEISITQCVAYSSAKTTEFVAEEVMDGSAVAHISLVDQYDQHVQYWIEPSGAFRPRRVQIEVEGLTYTTESQYEQTLPFPWLPTTIETIYRGPEGQIREQWKIDEIEAESDVKFDLRIFTIAGLQMAIGTPVADLATNRRIGYWDGQRLTVDSAGVPAEMKPQTPAESGRGLALIVFNVAAIAIILAVIGLRIWRNRSTP